MAAEGGASIPYLGSKISLISKSDIRYEGILYTVDAVDSTVALQNVRSFGTENRRPDKPVPPSNEIYDYIIFRGSDINDIHIASPQMPPMPSGPPKSQPTENPGQQIPGQQYPQQGYGQYYGYPPYMMPYGYPGYYPGGYPGQPGFPNQQSGPYGFSAPTPAGNEPTARIPDQKVVGGSKGISPAPSASTPKAASATPAPAASASPAAPAVTTAPAAAAAPKQTPPASTPAAPSPSPASGVPKAWGKAPTAPVAAPVSSSQPHSQSTETSSLRPSESRGRQPDRRQNTNAKGPGPAGSAPTGRTGGGGGAGGGGGNRGGNQDRRRDQNRGAASGAQQRSEDGAAPGQSKGRGRRADPAVAPMSLPAGDFDFSAAVLDKDKIRTELAGKVDGKDETKEGEEVESTFYNPKRSFFDNISTGVRDTSGEERANLSHQRQTDMDTFGLSKPYRRPNNNNRNNRGNNQNRRGPNPNDRLKRTHQIVQPASSH